MMRAIMRLATGLGGLLFATTWGAAALTWDALEKRYEAEPGEMQAEFEFVATNATKAPVEIVSVATSCSCTAGVMPRTPWVIEPGASDRLRVIMDLQSRRGGLTKTVYVATSDGEQLLLVQVKVPPPPPVQREMNMMMAQADRQAVLRDDCARCHVTPTLGKQGRELFETACQICHGATHRADFVPDLGKAAAGVVRDAAYWEKWIREGREGTLMPAFAKEHGGSLDEGQVASLVAYLAAHLPAGAEK